MCSFYIKNCCLYLWSWYWPSVIYTDTSFLVLILISCICASLLIMHSIGTLYRLLTQTFRRLVIRNPCSIRATFLGRGVSVKYKAIVTHIFNQVRVTSVIKLYHFNTLSKLSSVCPTKRLISQHKIIFKFCRKCITTPLTIIK